MSQDDHELGSVAAASLVMEDQGAAVRRATQLQTWLQMIIWGGVYGGIGLALLLVGADRMPGWVSVLFVGAVAAVVVLLAVATWGLGGGNTRRHRINNVIFVVASVGLVVVTVPAWDVRPIGGLPMVWVGTLASATLVALWVGISGVIAADPIRVSIGVGLGVVVAVLVVLLVVLSTDRAAAIFTVVAGAVSLAAALPVRRLEVRPGEPSRG